MKHIKEFIVFVVALMDWCSADCRDEKRPGELKFSSKMNSIDFGQIDMYKEIDCCANGYDQLKWNHRQSSGEKQWIPYPFSWGTNKSVRLKNANRTLAIEELPLEAHGTFECIATNISSKKTIRHTFNFGIKDTPGLPVTPMAPPKKACINATTLYVPCSGDFGKHDSFDVAIDWYYSSEEFHIAREPRFSVYGNMSLSTRIIERHEGTVREAILTLHNVTYRNNGTILTCVMYTSHKAGEDVKRFITTLTLCDVAVIPMDKWILIGVPVAAVICIISVMTGLFLVCYCCRIHIRQKFPNVYYKIYRGTDPWLGKKDYHALIHHGESQQDRELAQKLCDDITNLSTGYRLSVPEIDSEAGGIFTGIGDLARKSASLIIIAPASTKSVTSTEQLESKEENTSHTQKVPDQQEKDSNEDVHGIFFRNISSMLDDLFKDHKTLVTVIYRNKPKVQPAELRGLKMIESGEQNSRKWRNCLQILQLRMPIPDSKKRTDLKKTQLHDRNPQS